MSLWRQLSRGFRVLTHRAETDREVADEVEFYLEQATAQHLARGLTPEQALRAARMELGGTTLVREQIRGYGWENVVEALYADLRYALRRLRGEPGFTAITVLTLAIGIGGTTAIFSAVSPILFESLPYPDPGRIVRVQELGSDGTRSDGTFAMYRSVAERAHSLETVAVYKGWQPAITGSGQPEVLQGQRISAGFFQVLGVAPALGRGFEAADDQSNGACNVIVADALWRRHFGADPAIIGHPVTLSGNPCVIIGVMPAGFENVLAPGTQLWGPLQYDMTQGRAWGHHLGTIGRLRPGVGVEEASRELNAVGQAVVQELRPETYDPQFSMRALPLKDEMTRGVKPALLAILGAVSLVLIIACVNVTNLLLARGARRRGEFALRAALGAGQGRLASQLLTESLLLALLGGAVGMAVAVLGVRALVALSPAGLPRVAAIGVHGRVFAFGFALTTLIGLAFGLTPALQAARSDPHMALQQGTRRSSGAHRGTRNALVVAEVALALVLLVASGLLFRSLNRLFAVDPGFAPPGLITMQLLTLGPRYTEAGASQRFYTRALEAVERVPGVTAAALTSQLPLSGDLDEYGVHFEISPTERAEGGSTFRYAVSAGYLQAMGIPLRRGRLFGAHDDATAPKVALLSESYAARVFHGLDPIGQRLRIGPADGPPYSIIGIVGDVRQQSLTVSQSDAVYLPAEQWLFPDNAMSLVVRTRSSGAAMVPAIQQAIWSVDADQPIVRLATMDQLLDASAAQRRFALVLFEAFALAALILAGAGIYGVLSGSVVERTREIGVRAALGASRGMIVGLVLRQGMALTALGVVIGLAAAIAASPAIAALLFGVSRLDPITYASVIALLAGVAALACLVPAWRAARVDPVTTLRSE
jgi:putative ABC transport system permease protein